MPLPLLYQIRRQYASGTARLREKIGGTQRNDETFGHWNHPGAAGAPRVSLFQGAGAEFSGEPHRVPADGGSQRRGGRRRRVGDRAGDRGADGGAGAAGEQCGRGGAGQPAAAGAGRDAGRLPQRVGDSRRRDAAGFAADHRNGIRRAARGGGVRQSAVLHHVAGYHEAAGRAAAGDADYRDGAERGGRPDLCRGRAPPGR